jgi:very-short-patch-repair endonuclease
VSMDCELDELVARQDGVVTRQQVYASGMTRGQLRALVDGGRWRRLFGRVYATFTGPVPRRAGLWAVVLRAGRGALLSHRSAAELQGLVDGPTEPIQVIVPADRRVFAIPGVRVHLRSDAAALAHPTRLPPQTRIEETVLDLTQLEGELGDAIGWLARACGRRLTTADRILAAMGRRPKLRWRAELRAALTDTAAGCHSLLELRYLRDVERAHRLPTGERQADRPRRGGRWYDDVYYRDYRTRVELDGAAAHPADRRWRDAARDNAAAVAGETTLRYGWTDATTRSCRTAAQVAAVLRRNGWPAHPHPCNPTCPLPAPP